MSDRCGDGVRRDETGLNCGDCGDSLTAVVFGEGDTVAVSPFGVEETVRDVSWILGCTGCGGVDTYAR